MRERAARANVPDADPGPGDAAYTQRVASGEGPANGRRDGNHGLSRISVRVEANGQSHPGEHRQHVGAHVLRHDGLHVVLKEEAGHPSVVTTLSADGMEFVPPDVELLPASNCAVFDASDRDPGRTPPPRLDLPVGLHRNTDHHGAPSRGSVIFTS
jgi:hypothetical protein